MTLIKYAIDELGIATLTLDRDEKRNAFNKEIAESRHVDGCELCSALSLYWDKFGPMSANSPASVKAPLASRFEYVRFDVCARIVGPAVRDLQRITRAGCLNQVSLSAKIAITAVIAKADVDRRSLRGTRRRRTIDKSCRRRDAVRKQANRAAGPV
jgi:hypothetical protein